MDTFVFSKASLPEPSVSEEGTFCESFNDTISRLEQEYERADMTRNDAKANRDPSPAKSGGNWDQKSEFVDPLCDVSSIMSKISAPHAESPMKTAQNVPDDAESDAATAQEAPEVTGESLAAQAADRFAYNRHNESIFDDFRYFPSLSAEQSLVVKFDEKDPECISHATLKALIVQLTSPEVIDYNLICDFFLTYRTFADAHTVLNLLLTRLIWSLQYINSQKADTEKLGKLVLLRTFVVMRHWILNYFYDDFEQDDRLCDLFAFNINQITAELGLLAPHMAFELKIFGDLKTHWLTQINEFFGCTFATAIPGTVLPMAAEYFAIKRLTKSNTEASIHTNPSFRRSAMLSLYDQKTHHKCMVYDAIAASDAVQLPISNLVNQHKSSRMSLDDKLKEYCTKKGTKKDSLKFALASRREPLAPKHNYLSLKDSSLALKKTTHVPQTPAPTSLDITKPGFSTNGRVKLPSSRITTIVPLSPVKKMHFNLKDELRGPAPYDSADVGRKKSIKRIVEGWTKSLYSPELRSDKSTFSLENGDLADAHSAAESEPLPEIPAKNREIGDRVDVLSARIVDELEFVIRYYIFDSRQTITETEGHDDISRATIAFSPKKKVTDILFPASALEKKNTRESNATTTKDMSIQDISELNIEKIDNLFSQTSIGEHSDELGDSFNSLGRKSHTFAAKTGVSRGSKRSSFGGRVASINWNDDGNLFLENSTLLCDTSARPETKFYDVSDEHNKSNVGRAKTHLETQSSDLDFSDVEQYDAEVSDLGIAMSPQSLKRKPVQRISLHERLGPSVSAKGLLNLSRNSSDSMARHESLKSYTSYDSAFSAVSESSRNENFNSNLKKKHGYQDLRKLAEDGDLHHLIFARLSTSSNVSTNIHRINRASMVSHFSKTSSLTKKSTRLSTLCALTELPFNLVRDSYASASTRALFQDESGKMSDLSVSSVFSIAATREQRIARDSKDDLNIVSSASVAIPGISNNILRELASIPDESFSSKNPVQYALFKLEGKSGSSSHINDSDIETPNGEKVTAPLFERSGLGVENGTEETKTNGKHALEANSTLIHPEQDAEVQQNGGVSAPEISVSKSVHYDEGVQSSQPKTPQESAESNDLFQNTEDILDEINNAVTEDAIGYSSDIENELRNRPITPIKTRSKSTLLLSQSISNANAFSSLPASESGSPYSLLNPKLVLDGYYLASENLSVKQAMAAGSHVSFILSYDSRAIAEHFTIIERDMLQEIDWKELIELKWNKELTPVNSWLEIIVNDEYYNKNKGVNLVIARFNLVVNWIISEILLTKDEDERREIISRFIHIAYHSYEMQNFSTLMQVVLALTSEKVNKLKSTWNNLNPGDILTLKHLEQMSSPLKNFINMRVSTNQIKPSKGCIPFVGLYLSDLIFNAERPKFVKTKKDPVATSATNEDSCELSTTQGDSTMTTSPGVEAEKMINFSRFRTSVHIVKSLSQSIEWSQNYDVTVDDELLRKCLYIKSLDEGEMNFCLEQLDK